LSTLGLGMIIPRVRLFGGPELITIPTPILDQPISYEFTMVNEVVATQMQDTPVDWITPLHIIYVVVALLMAVRLSMSFLRIHRLYKNGERTKLENHTRIITSDDQPPFSFLSYYFISQSDHNHFSNQSLIWQHEKVHIKQRHSWDILLVEVIKVLFWFSPLIYFYKHAMRDVHEFHADQTVAANADLKSYRELLIRQAMPRLKNEVVHYFSTSNIKFRLDRIGAMPSGRADYMRYCLVAPLILLLAWHFSHDIPLTLNAESEEIVDLLKDPLQKCQNSNYTLEVMAALIQRNDTMFIADDTVHITRGFPCFVKELDYQNIADVTIQDTQTLVTFLRPNTVCYKSDGNTMSITLKTLGLHHSIFESTVLNKNVEYPLVESCQNSTGQDQEKCSQKTLLTSIYTKIRYPAVARRNFKEGLVIGRVKVKRDGTFGKVRIMKKIDHHLDEEVRRIVRDLEDTFRTHNVHFKGTLTIPVLYRLEDGTEKAIDIEKYLEKYNKGYQLPKVVVVGLPPTPAD